jgi:cytochrome c biogenesis protein CcdA
LTLIALSEHLGKAALLLTCYSVGAALPMLLVGYGGQYVTARLKRVMPYTRLLQRGFGVVIILVAIAIFTEYDAVITVWLSRFYPDLPAGL